MGLQFFRYFVSFSGYSKNHTVYDNINEVNNFFFPDDPEIPKLSEEDMLNCEGIISKDE
jgi:hypothetical protein